MRTVIEYIRQCFCKHQYELLDKATVYDSNDTRNHLPLGERYVYMCKKCGRVKCVKTY